MKKQLLTLLVITLVLTSCSKKKEKEEHLPVRLINANVFLDHERVYSRIAFVDASRTDIVKDRSSVDAFFETNPPHSVDFENNFTDYLPAGDYLIIVQIAPSAFQTRAGKFSYKQISTKTEQSFGNNMEFKTSDLNEYQPWNEKK